MLASVSVGVGALAACAPRSTALLASHFFFGSNSTLSTSLQFRGAGLLYLPGGRDLFRGH